MLIEIHMIQNHSPANMNRDDLGAPKTCYFGGVLRSRISSQCLKRSIRLSEEFAKLRGGLRTRDLARQIAQHADGLEGPSEKTLKRVEKVLEGCGIKLKSKKAKKGEDTQTSDRSKMLVYTTHDAIAEMAALITEVKDDKVLTEQFKQLISKHVAVPDMALSGRMLETGEIANTTVEASLQVAHAISTHAALPEVDYYIAADDIKGDDAGAGYVDEAMFSSACFYKYFSIHWEQLVKNLNGNEELAAHTVGAFIQGAMLATPSGKQNSFAANNPPDGVLVEFKDSPVSYANAFAEPANTNNRDLVSQSIAQLARYVHDLDVGYGKPKHRLWFSPNLRYPLAATVSANGSGSKEDIELAAELVRSIDDLVPAVVAALPGGFTWADVQKVVVNNGDAS